GCGGFGAHGASAPDLVPSPASSTAGSTTSGATASPNAGPTLLSLVVATDGLTLAEPGVGQQLTVAGLYDDGHVRDLTHAAAWSVGDATVAAVDSNAIAWPVGAGTTTLEADFGGLSATGTLTVASSAL